MTTPWQVPKIWEDKTVAVLASGPGMNQALADSVRHLPCIAVRSAYKLAPWAEMLVALDGPQDAEFWADSAQFAGPRICGVECDLEVLYLNLPYEVVTLGPAHIVHIRNNGLAAIRIAAMAGASKILLLGFDTERYEALHGFRGLTEGLAALEAELCAQGVVVERVVSGDGSGVALPALPDDGYASGAASLEEAPPNSGKRRSK